VVDGSEQLPTLNFNFKYDVAKFITECDRLIQFNFYTYTACTSSNNVALKLA